MDTADDIDKLFIDSMSNVGKEIFSDFLSDLTRTRQTAVLVSSVVTILISFALITLSETEISGMKIVFVNSSIASMVFGVICIYFLLVYVVSVLEDLEFYRYKTMPAFFIRGQLISKLAKLVVEETNQVFERDKVIQAKLEKRKEFLNQAKIIKQKYQPEIDELKAKLANFNLLTGEVEQAKLIQDRLDQLDQQSWQEQKAIYDFVTEYAKEDGIDELVSEQTKSARDDTTNEKLQFILTAQKRYLLFNKVRLAIEIVFPIGLSLFAVGSVIWAAYK